MYCKSGPGVMKLCSCSTQLRIKVVLLINLKLLTLANFFLLNIDEHENDSANNMKMPTVVDMLRSISREHFLVGCVENENSFIIASGQGCFGFFFFVFFFFVFFFFCPLLQLWHCVVSFLDIYIYIYIYILFYWYTFLPTPLVLPRL